MKKTLAAVLAAAMALSTASVAFATDTVYSDADLSEVINISGDVGIDFGKEYKYLVGTTISEKLGIDEYDLGKILDEGWARISVVVTEGSSRFATKPTISLVNAITSETVTETSYKWAANVPTIKFNGKTVTQAGKAVNGIPTASGDVFSLTEADIVKVVYPGDDGYEDLLKNVVANYGPDGNPVHVEVDSNKVTSTKLPVPQLKFKVAHTYGTSSVTVGMKFKITFTEDVTVDGTLFEDGDTIITDEVKFKAEYDKMNDVSTDMELTLDECDDNFVLLNKDGELYDKIGNDDFTLYFEDFAAFTGKMSSAQKVQNMYYSVDEIDEIVDAYPDVDFEMIQFLGTPSFTNSGSMTFNAIGGRDTTVYTFDGETLTPLDTTYDSTYGTVTAKGIKKLGTFVVASEVLEVEEEEEEEPKEPADETPAVEEKNPATGAC